MRFRFALITDVHFGPPAKFAGQLRKLSHTAPALTRTFVTAMNDGFRPELVVNLGDVIEDEGLEQDRAHYREFLEVLSNLRAPILHVAGNHDTINLADQTVSELWNREGSLFYSEDVGPLHFAILRTVETQDVRVDLPAEQLDWLEADLGRTTRPVIVLMHHPASDMRLEGNHWFERAPHICRVANRKEIRSVLERRGNVVAVFNGHVHWNHLDVIRGIPYITVQSLTENIDEDAPGRPAAAWAEVELEERRLSVHVVGEQPQRYQFEL